MAYRGRAECQSPGTRKAARRPARAKACQIQRAWHWQFVMKTPPIACVKIGPVPQGQRMTHVTDFFIAGSPKCGTTALFEYLASHRGVFMPPCKEPNYFCSDIDVGSPHPLSAYQALYAAAPPRALTGDASALYLYSQVAIRDIMAHNADAKIILMMRHPVEAASSLYADLRGHGYETAPDFEQAWRLQPERLRGRGLPPGWSDAKTLQYGAIYRYAPQLRRLLHHVPRTQCLILMYEEFFADPTRQFAQVLEFLNLPPDPARTSFPRVNPMMEARSLRLQRLLANPPAWLTAASSPLVKLAHAAGAHPRQTLARLNRFRGQKPALSERFRQELEEYFADDVAEAEALLSRKLWPLAGAVRPA